MAVIQEISKNSDSSSHAIVRSMMTLPDGKWANMPLRMFFSVCNNAACACADMAISLVPDGKEEPQPEDSVLRFTVDVSAHKLASTDEANDIAQDVARHFDDDDWHTLWRAFSDIKMECTENLELERTHADFPMQKEIETEGLLVPYGEILPYCRKFFLESSEGSILLDEQYCLRRGCDCDSVAVSFVPLDEEGKQSGKSAMLEIGYRSGKVTSSENGSLTQTPHQLFKIFLEMYPDLLKRFSKRHKQLTELYRTYRKSQPKAEIRAQQKAGRNDPCPCGSGKKFKKCCMT
jgi:hypothetical protein